MVGIGAPLTANARSLLIDDGIEALRFEISRRY
jgi:hypothetical protein